MNIDDDRDSTIFIKGFNSELGMVQARQSRKIGISPLSSMAEHPDAGNSRPSVRFTLRIDEEDRILNDSIYQGGTAGINLLVPIWDEEVFFIEMSSSRRHPHFFKIGHSVH